MEGNRNIRAVNDGHGVLVSGGIAWGRPKREAGSTTETTQSTPQNLQDATCSLETEAPRESGRAAAIQEASRGAKPLGCPHREETGQAVRNPETQAAISAPLCPSCFTALLSCSNSSGFLITVTGPLARILLRIHCPGNL